MWRAPSPGAGVVCEMLPSMGEQWALPVGPMRRNHRAGPLLYKVVSSVNEAVLGQ